MRATSTLSDERRNRSVVTTARHMADAVSYLTRVASDAGLRGIAGKLAGVRANLLNVVAGRPEDDEASAPDGKTRLTDHASKEDRDDRRKPS